MIVFKKNNTGLLRVGFSVSKKIGNSVTRNLVKRRLRSALDQMKQGIDPNYNIIIIARHPILSAKFADLMQSMEGTLKKGGLLLAEDNDRAVETN